MKSLNRIFLLFACFLSCTLVTEAQVGINILQPDTSAILHLESTDRGFLPPRMTTAQRDNIFSPKPGLTIFNTQDSSLQYYTGRCWLPVWQEDCDQCLFDFSIGSQSGNIDRIMGNSDSTQLFVNQSNGSDSIGVYVIANLPQGITVSIDQAIVTGTDTIKLTVTADIFAPAGTYPIVIQAACGGAIKSQVYFVVIEPCIEIDLIAPTLNYDLQAANNLPTGTPICVVLRVPPGLEMTNDTSGAPVYTTGGLHPQSRVGIHNQGFLLARGGNGGVGAGLQGQTGNGEDGTDAMVLTTHTHLINTGRIYGGGGGGGSVGFLATIPVGGPVGNFNIGIGAGGGGGAQLGIGGDLGTGLGYYEAGNSATGGMLAASGNGGVLVTPIAINIPIPFVNPTITITPAVYGGNGGGYGLDGLAGSLTFNIDLAVVGLSVFNQNFPDPPIQVFPPGGQAGQAIRKNGNVLQGVLDANYQTTNIKGVVGN